MFDFLEGRVAAIEAGRISLDVHGVGYQIAIPQRSLDSFGIGDSSKLLVHLAITETSMTLFGFAEPQERTLFRFLLSVSGVGPSLAMAILSDLPPAILTGAVRAGDHARLQTVRGVGRKTAQRILLDLRDRLQDFASSEAATGEQDLSRLLTQLGFSEQEANEASRRIAADSPDLPLEEQLRLALSPSQT